jgi:CheY-like chemotaxis protein
MELKCGCSLKKRPNKCIKKTELLGTFKSFRACNNDGNAYLREILLVNIVPQSHQNEKNLVPKAVSSKFILFGEDDIDDEELLKELFSSVDCSFELTFINNGRQLIEHLDTLQNDQLPCLLILDYNMPELNGAEILENLKAKHRYADIPKIIWSTSGTETYRKKCLELGAEDYIIKPSRVSDLVQAIKYIISYC